MCNVNFNEWIPPEMPSKLIEGIAETTRGRDQGQNAVKTRATGDIH